LLFFLCVVLLSGRAAIAQGSDAATKAILGEWLKNSAAVTGHVIIIRSDGTFDLNGRDGGKWKWIDKANKKFEVDHGRGGAYTLTLSADGMRATGVVTRSEEDRKKVGTNVEFMRKGVRPSVVTKGEPESPSSPTPTTPAPSKPSAPTLFAPPSPSSPESAGLVKQHRSNLVFITMDGGSGSGFVASYGNGTYLITNAHVTAGAKGAVFKTLEGTQVQAGAPAVAVGHDIFLMALPAAGAPLPVMIGVDEHASIGDEVVVLGNAEGAGVINTITGKIVGIGPNLVEVDAPFQPGNSGSPIIHLKTGKVIGVATYLTYRKYDAATREAIKNPVIRRFGYRLDSVKKWEPVDWRTFNAQAAEMEAVEGLTEDLADFLGDLAKDGRVSRGAHTNPVIKNRIDAWIEAKSKRLSPRDEINADQSMLSFLKVTCQTDVAAAQKHLTYDYFQRQLAEQQKERSQIADFFTKIIQELRNKR
jgi:S1-C subfamily serine protease